MIGKRSEARQFLSRLSDALGTAGVFMGQKCSPGPEGADNAFKWPKCQCGNPVCPDYEGTAEKPTDPTQLTPAVDRLREQLRERNRHSGGLL